MTASNTEWWRHAAIYQIYPRSFADSNSDGIGDLPGIIERLPYVAGLDVDAIWFSPWYTSPMADAGYDIADPRDIDPSFGTLADAEHLIERAHELGLRIIVDVVPNHGSTQHAWFIEALSAAPGDAIRELFHFADGRGADGELPPNDWTSIFGGPAWTRTPDGQWYLHLFAPEQPDYNWENDKVREEHEDVLRFWFDRGADGVRIDSAAMLVKDPELTGDETGPIGADHPYIDRDEVHDIYRGWRTVADGYQPPRALIGEVWLADTERFTRYLRADEMHSAFNFDFLNAPWEFDALHKVITETMAVHDQIGAPATWVLSNHDVTRHVTRFGREYTGFDLAPEFRIEHHLSPTDPVLGLRRARAAALLTFALPGAVYIYQGDELGLGEVEDIPARLRQDPMWARSGFTNPGRDGCRVPLPWSGTASPFGFSPGEVVPWLPQPASWASSTVEAQERDPASMLRFYRAALAARGSITGSFAFSPAPAGVLGFVRGKTFCWVNFSAAPVALPSGSRVLIASGASSEVLGPDEAVWFTAG